MESMDGMNGIKSEVLRRLARLDPERDEDVRAAKQIRALIRETARRMGLDLSDDSGSDTKKISCVS